MAFAPVASQAAACVPQAAPRASARRAAAALSPPAAAPAQRFAAGRLAAAPRGARCVAAAAAAGVKDRGEWTRFLEWSDDAARASVDCVLLAGGTAAQVTVVAPDRPGLLSDIASTIASMGLTIDKAQVTTPDDKAKDVFTVSCKNGEQLTEARMSSIRTAILNGAGKSVVLKPITAQARSVDAVVEVFSFENPGGPSIKPTWVVTVESDDTPGLLSKMMAGMSKLGLDVCSANLRTLSGRVESKFSVLRKDGVTAQDIVEALKSALR